MELHLRGKKALVMSSSRGLGAGIASELAAEGVDVLLTGRNVTQLQKLTDKINAAGGGGAEYETADLAKLESVEILAKAVEEKFGGADILIANTGGPPPGRMVESDVSNLTTHFDIMVARVAAITGRLTPYMQKKAGVGSLLLVLQVLYSQFLI
jgi:3-oxoacyl-[acyl-carrier protein] reductase